MAPQPEFDYFPRGHPWVVNDAIESTINEALEAGQSPDTIIESIRYEEVRQLRSSQEYRDRLHEAFTQSGVNLVSPTMGRASLNNPVTYAKKAYQELALWQARIDTLDWMEKATSPQRAREIVADGNVGVVPNTQNIGVEAYDDLRQIEDLYNGGIRIMQLTYNNQNLIGSSGLERQDAGLTEHGVDVVEKLNELDVVVDLSHCGEQTTFDAIELSDAPVAFTHTLCQTIDGLERGQTDEELQALAENDGYMGFLALPTFLAPGREDDVVDVFFEHLEHAIEHVGVDRVGVGTDWGRWTLEVPEPLRESIERSYAAMGFKGRHFIGTGMSFGPMEKYAQRHDVFISEFEERGYDDDDVNKIMGDNFVSYWERVVG